jgi:two-component system chemotaxis response regulator CheY
VPRALVVDDTEDLRKVVRRILEAAGYDVDEAQDGRAALERFRAQPADVVLTDIYMDGMDGIQFTRALEREFGNVPIIAMSGGGVVQEAPATLEVVSRLGARATLTKPFSADQLLAAIARVRKDRPS